MKNTQINRKATIKVAKALGDLNDQVVFVGGVVVSLYIDDPAADDVRPTKDVDLSFKILTGGDLEKLREKLNQRGFKQSHTDDVICRFSLDDVKVDIMSTHQVGWAPANRWFEKGFELAVIKKLDDISIKIMPLSYFLAAKFDAFKGRGSKDARTSHDFEDIVYILNYTSDFTKSILVSDTEVKEYLRECFNNILNSEHLQEAIIGHLYYEESEERYQIILNQLKEIMV
ncbi:nucleotidyl transferase AbiEii/AbiGii toxin family protein [Marivirga sp.]|uniref:nucleotidyl transferase AbiEii/AbiGii toxin family protein n=1 Tax=Marivirga sp. TaxID=2018662 RepID=UPI0025D4902C|nr:nucleotidyl transferase AbiEii/AbiGii toxin family protein [Marivirga sp.]